MTKTAWKLLIALVGTLMFTALTAVIKGETCYESDRSRPLVVLLTGKDANGTVLYHRKAYIFFDSTEEYGVPQRMVARETVTIERVTRNSGEKCNDVAPVVIEKGVIVSDNCHVVAVTK